LSDPPWQDDPRTPFSLIKRYLGGRDDDPQKSHERSVTARQELTDELRAKFDSDDEKLLEFEAVLEAAQQFAPIKEAHARLQLVGTGSLRVPCLALVRKLKATGLVEDVDDVFYLHLREFQEIADDEPVQNMKAIIAERRANREKWQNIVPPAFEGVAPVRSGNPSSDDYEESREDQPDLLRGLAASKGIVSGRATVVRTLEEGSRLEEGAILVCRSTSPSWTPLIARASAVVTDTGGVLPHTAIVAREFGIPCVVGTGNATSIIVDGGEGRSRATFLILSGITSVHEALRS